MFEKGILAKPIPKERMEVTIITSTRTRMISFHLEARLKYLLSTFSDAIAVHQNSFGGFSKKEEKEYVRPYLS